jgi:hypothetical protein
LSKEEIPNCIRCGTPQEYNPYQNFWYCTDPDCPPGRSRFPFNLAEELLKLEKENKEKKNLTKIDFKELTKIKIKKIKEKTIIFSEDVEEWCLRPYPNHPNGCPNFNHHLCLPYAPFLRDYIDNYSYFYLVYVHFNFAKYKESRKEENPEFFNSENRLKCLLYWQNSVKKLLREKIERLIHLNTDLLIAGCGSGMRIKGYNYDVYSMEAMGINVFSTLKLNKIPFELRPKNMIILCSLICAKNGLNFKRQKKLDEV